MSNFSICNKCKEYDYTDSHKCHPIWEVQEEGEPKDDWVEVYAFDEEDAAGKYGEAYDTEGDYLLSQGGKVTVIVRAPGSEDVKVFVVSAEPDVNYSATEVEDK